MKKGLIWGEGLCLGIWKRPWCVKTRWESTINQSLIYVSIHSFIRLFIQLLFLALVNPEVAIWKGPCLDLRA